MTDLAKLVVKLEAETAKYQSELEKAKRQLAGFDKSVNETAKRIGAGVGAAAVGAAVGFAAMVKSAIDAADEMSKLAQSTGVSTEALSQLQYVADLSGVDDLGGSLAKLNKTIGEAAEGGKAQTEAFARLGISVRDAEGNIRSTEEVLGDVADAFASTEDGAAKTKIAMDLFGRSGAQLIPMLNGGRAGLAELRAEADAFGLTLDGRVAQAAERVNDNLTRLSKLAEGFALQSAAAMMPTLEGITQLLVDAGKNATITGDSFRDTQIKIAAFSASILDAAEKIIIFSKAALNLGPGIVVNLFRGKTPMDSIKEFKDALAAPSAGTRLFDEALASMEKLDKAAKKTGTEIDLALGGGGGGGAKADPVQSTIDALAEQAATLGYNERAMTLFKLASDGATESQLALATQLLDNIDSYNQATAATEKYRKEQAELDALAEKWGDTIAGITPAQSQFNDSFAELNRLIEAGRISWDEYNAGVDAVQRKLDEAGKKAKETTDGMSVYAEQAARNMQDAFADFLFDPLDRGLSGMLQSFAETLRRMAAEAAAAEIFDALIPKNSSGKIDFSTIATTVGEWFGGGKADGGYMTPGKAYWVGEEGPELVLPTSAGTVVPHDESMRMARGVTIVQNITTPDADSFRRSSRQITREFRRRAEV